MHLIPLQELWSTFWETGKWSPRINGSWIVWKATSSTGWRSHHRLKCQGNWCFRRQKQTASHRKWRALCRRRRYRRYLCRPTRSQARKALSLSAVCSPKEGRRRQTSCEPKGSQFVRQAGIFQNGRTTSAERSPLASWLDDESRSERYVLRHSPQLPGQKTPEVPMARETVTVQLPTIRTVVGSVDLYQGHKASGDYSQNPGHENYHLHRRHPRHGTKQRDCSAAHRLSDFLAGELGVHQQSAEISDRPLAKDRILGSHCRLNPNGALTTGFKDQEHSVRCQDSAASKSTHGSGSVEVTGKVNPCNSRMRAAPPPPLSSSGNFSHAFMPPCNWCRTTLNLALWQKRQEKNCHGGSLTQRAGMGNPSFEAIRIS